MSDSMSLHGGRGPRFGGRGLVCLLVLAAGVGLVPALVGTTVSLAICAVGLAVSGLAVVRRVIGPAPASSEEETGPLHDRDDGFSPRLARWLFYAATLALGWASVRPALGLTISEALFLASLAVCCAEAIRGRPIAVVPPWLVMGVLIFAFGGLISSVNARSTTTSLVEVVHGVYVMLLWVWTGAMVLRSRRHFGTVLVLWSLSIAISGVAAISQALGVNPLSTSPQGNRMTGLTHHPNDLGGSAAVVLVPALMAATWRMTVQPIAIRTMRWLAVTLVVVALVLSGSVAAMAGASAALLVWVASPVAGSAGRIAVLVLIAAALLAVSITGDRVTDPIQRLEQVTSPESALPGSGSGRVRIATLKVTWPTIEESPILGQGLDRTVTVISEGHSVEYQIHGAPLAVWYQAGIFGLIGFLVVLVASIHSGFRAVRFRASEGDAAIGWCLMAAVLAFVVFAMTTPFVYHQYGWFAAVLVVSWSLRVRAVVSAPRPGVPLLRVADPTAA